MISSDTAGSGNTCLVIQICVSKAAHMAWCTFTGQELLLFHKETKGGKKESFASLMAPVRWIQIDGVWNG